MKEDVYELLQQVYFLQGEVEKGKGTFVSGFGTESMPLGSCLISLASQCSRILWNNENFSSPSDELSTYLYSLKLSVSFLAMMIQKCINKETNYFGDFNSTIYSKDAKLVIDHLEVSIKDGRLFQVLQSGRNKRKEQSYKHTIAPVKHTELLIQLLWKKYFGNTESVFWNDFIQAFQDEYGIQHEETLEKFHKLLFRSSKLSNHHLQHQQLPTILSIQQLYAFCEPSLPLPSSSTSTDLIVYYSLFHAYHAQCSDHSLIYVVGECQEVYGTPTVMRSLVGLSIRQISCGNAHIVAITEGGLAYSWGNGSLGRLGHGSEQRVQEPQLITTLRHTPLESISCGHAFTIAIARTGALYSWGAGANGRLGLGDEMNRSLPTMVEPFCPEKLLSVHTGSIYACVLSSAGKVYSFGKAAFTGHGERQDTLRPTAIVHALQEEFVVQIAVAKEGFHTMALTKSKKLFAWGHNRVGQLGIPSDNTMERNDDGGYYQPIPREIVDKPAQDITQIALGWGHSILLTADHTVYTCGRNVEGQLGYTGNRTTLLSVNERGHRYQPCFTAVNHPDLQHRTITAIQGGGEFTLVQVDDHDFIAFGTNPIPATTVSATTTAEETTASSETSFLARASNQITSSISVSSPSKLYPNSMINPTTTLITFFQQEKKTVHQMTCGFDCIAVLVKGARQPYRLQKIAADMIRATPSLYYTIYPTEQDEEEMDRFEVYHYNSHSSEYASPSRAGNNRRASPVRLPGYLRETIQSLM